MKILFLTQLLPYPSNTGGKFKTYQILKLLAKKNEIHLLSFADCNEDLSGEKKLRIFCKSIKTIVAPIITKKHRDLISKIILSFFLRKSFIVYKYCSQNLQNYVSKILSLKTIDLFYIDHINMAQYIPNWYQGNIICDEHNVSYLVYKRYARLEHNIFKKIWFLNESKHLENFEKKYTTKFSHIFTISNVDKKLIINLGIHPRKITFLPIPIKIKKKLFNNNIKNPLLLFVGMLSWRSNEKGIIWFINDIWPSIKKKIPNIQLKIIGDNGEKIIKFINSSNDSNIRYLGYIKDLTGYYKETSVFIVPILTGGGIRIKILNALSKGIPIVSTGLGAEGIEVENEKELLIADTPEDFANAIIRIINDKKLAKKLSRNAIDFIRNNYSLEKAEKVLEIINQI